MFAEDDAHKGLDAIHATRATCMLHIAPMAAVSDRHWRTLLRCASPAAVVWTEMTWAHSIADDEPSEAERVIGFSAAEHPVNQ